MPFEILTRTEATLTTFTGRVETHGKSKVPAVSFRLRFSGPNTLLDLLSPDVRKTLYMAAEGQEDLPGVEPTTPLLRCKNIKTWSPENAYEGWTVTVDRTGNDQDAIEMGGCKIDAFTADLHDDPGAVDIECRIGTSNLTPEQAGYLWSKMKQKVFVMLAAPLTPSINPDAGMQDPNQLTLDGSTGAEIGEPSAARLAADAAFQPGSEGMDPNAPDATAALLDDIEKHGVEATAKTPAQIRGAKGAATRKAKLDATA